MASFSNKETTKVAKTFFEKQKELTYLRNNRIILKDNTTSSATLAYEEVQIKGEIAEYKDLLHEQISTEDKRKFNEYYQFNPKDLL